MKWEIDFVTPIDNISWIQIHAALLFGSVQIKKKNLGIRRMPSS